MSELRISVIMSIYNEEINWVEKAVESILTQTYKYFEFIIVLDNPENIKLKKLILSYRELDKRIVFLVNEKNIGLANSMNLCLRHAKGKYIARMDADDIAVPDRLEKQLNFLMLNRDISLVGSNVIYIDEEGTQIGFREIMPEDCDSTQQSLKYLNMFFHPTFMFRKKDIQFIDGYRNLTCSQDYDLLCRLSLKGFKLANLNVPLLFYRVRQNGISIGKALNQKIIMEEIKKKYRQRDVTIFDDYFISELNGKISYLNEKDQERFSASNTKLIDSLKYYQSKAYGKAFASIVEAMLISRHQITIYTDAIICYASLRHARNKNLFLNMD